MTWTMPDAEEVKLEVPVDWDEIDEKTRELVSKAIPENYKIRKLSTNYMSEFRSIYYGVKNKVIKADYVEPVLKEWEKENEGELLNIRLLYDEECSENDEEEKIKIRASVWKGDSE